MPEFYQPGKASYLVVGMALPEDSKYPLVVLFDPTPSREIVASSLASAGWGVLAVNSAEAADLGAAVDLICPLPALPRRKTLKVSAMVTEAYHPLHSSNNTTRAALPLPAEALVYWLEERGLPSSSRFSEHEPLKGLPYLLYTANETMLTSARNDLIFASQSKRFRLALFSAAIERRGNGLELLPSLNYLTQYYCCHKCHALLASSTQVCLDSVRGVLLCQCCASNSSSYSAFFPAYLLTKAAYQFAARPPVGPLELVPASTDPWN